MKKTLKILKIFTFISTVDRYLNKKSNTAYIQDYLETKKDKTEEERLALKESKIISGAVISVILAFVSFFGTMGIGIAVGYYVFDLDILISLIIGIFAAIPLGSLGTIVAANVASYPQRHWYTYINKITKIMNESGYSTLGLTDADFFEDFNKLKASLGSEEKMSQRIADEEMDDYSKHIFKQIIVGAITIVVVMAIAVIFTLIKDSKYENKFSIEVTTKEQYTKNEVLEIISEAGKGSIVYYIEQETEVNGEKRVLFYYCTEDSKTVTKLMTRVNSDNSYTIHYKTVSSDETPQSIMQNEDVKKLNN